ncbi:MAG TPA: aminoglycoside 6-adenylyltransferase [Ktedonobacterales bacterium]|jgi:predicted nucleotidyltransferase
MDDLAEKRQAVIQRFVVACQDDERVVAAFLGGSYAREAADAYSDIDFGLITADEAYDTFFADRATFIRLLGEPAFLEDWRGSQGDVVFFTFPDGVECELMLGRESQFTSMHTGPYKVLLDKTHLLDGVLFPPIEVARADQIAALRGLISWFWHDLSHHFITPLARGQLWSAYGALQDLRQICVNLARLSANVGAELEGYEKVEQAVPEERLAPLVATCCGLDRGAMLQAALIITRYFRELAVPLAHQYGLAYPAALDRIMRMRLETLRASG